MKLDSAGGRQDQEREASRAISTPWAIQLSVCDQMRWRDIVQSDVRETPAAALHSSRILRRPPAAYIISVLRCDLTSASGFGTVRHIITAVGVKARKAYLERGMTGARESKAGESDDEAEGAVNGDDEDEGPFY